jgi:hypothetical protein
MSHFANLDENNIVTNVVVCDNNDPNGDEGYQWLIDNLGGRWVQTSMNTLYGVHRLGGVPLRKNYAGIGYTYDEQRDAFIPPKPFNSWVLDEETCQWKPPVPAPPLQEFAGWKWNEETISWVAVPFEETM